MSHRLLIKSTLCTHYNGVWSEEVRDGEGNVIVPRTMTQAPFEVPEDATYVVSLATRTLTITCGLDTHILPIPDSAYAQRGME